MLLRRAAAVTPRILIAGALLAGTAAAQTFTPLGTGPWNPLEKRTLPAGESFAFEVGVAGGTRLRHPRGVFGRLRPGGA